MPRISFTPSRLFAVALAVGMLAGCADSPLQPPLNGEVAAKSTNVDLSAAAGFGSGSFFPLAVGNHREYTGSWFVCNHRDGSEVSECLGQDLAETRRQIGTTDHDGVTYVVEEQTQRNVFDGGSVTRYSRVRQDRSGLYALDPLLDHAPALVAVQAARLDAVQSTREDHLYRLDTSSWREAGYDPLPFDDFSERIQLMREAVHGVVSPDESVGLEQQLLAYPLSHGASWNTHANWPAWVDGVEVLDTPVGKFPAYRIGLNPFGRPLQEGEWIHIWYSREGYLGYSIHATTRPTQNGQPLGFTYEFDETMRIVSLGTAP